jgi:hypothetical protein
VEWYARGAFQLLHMFVHFHSDFVQVFGCVLILHCLDVEVHLVVSVAFVELVRLGNGPFNYLSNSESSLVCPAPTHILDSVATTSEHDQRYPKRHHFE